jgi:hypothetical protein
VVARPITGSEEGSLLGKGSVNQSSPVSGLRSWKLGGRPCSLRPLMVRPSRIRREWSQSLMGVVRMLPSSASPTLGRIPSFAVCYSPDHRERQSGSACIDFLFDQVFADSRVAGLAAVTPPRRVYALGAPWLGLLRELPSAAVVIKSTRDLPLQVRLAICAHWLIGSARSPIANC